MHRPFYVNENIFSLINPNKNNTKILITVHLCQDFVNALSSLITLFKHNLIKKIEFICHLIIFIR